MLFTGLADVQQLGNDQERRLASNILCIVLVILLQRRKQELNRLVKVLDYSFAVLRYCDFVGIADFEAAVKQHVVHPPDFAALEICKELREVCKLVRTEVCHNLLKRLLNVMLLSRYHQLYSARQRCRDSFRVIENVVCRSGIKFLSWSFVRLCRAQLLCLFCILLV